MRLPTLAFVVCLLASAAFAQNPRDVTFTLALKDGRTTFRMGEPVEVELRFGSTSAGRYLADLYPERRFVRLSRFDTFLVEPKENTADPLADIPAQFQSTVSSVGPTARQLSWETLVVSRQLNESISFRSPGRYRISARTTRLTTADQSARTVPLQSNSIEIEVVAPEPGWAAAQLRDAVATLAAWGPAPPKIGQIVDPRIEEAVARAARVLRFLEVREAVQPLARFFEHGPQNAQQDLRAGLFASPYRNDVIAAMELSINAPDIPISYYYFGTLVELAAALRLGPQPDAVSESRDPEGYKRWMEEHKRYLDRQKPIATEYATKLALAAERKQGEARALTLETLRRIK
jgi:hypothetical protein